MSGLKKISGNIHLGFGAAAFLALLGASFSYPTAAYADAAQEDKTNQNSQSSGQPRTRNKLSMDDGQLKIHTAMTDMAEYWYDLSFVRNSTPPKEDRGDPYKNTRPGYACKETKVNLTDNIDDFPLFSSVPSNVYLGSVIKGDTLLTGNYGVFNGPKNSAKITISAPMSDKTLGTEMMSPISQSQYLEAIRKMLHDGIGNVPASLGFSIERIFSQDQLAFKMKANVSGSNFDVAAQFSIDNTTTSQYVLVSVTQVYFRAYLDRPDYGAELFANNLTETDVQLIIDQMTKTNPPLYISSIDYGRKLYILMESTDSAMDIKAMVSAGYKGVVDASGEVDLEVKQALQSMSARGFIIGGSSTLGANAVVELFGGGETDGFDALGGIKKWLQEGAEPSDTNLPAALGYEFSFLLDGSKSMARSATEYTETDCNVGVCPSGFHWGKKYASTWFEINFAQRATIAPAAGLIGDIVKIQDGWFYTYDFPTCNRIEWSNVSLECVPNERMDFEAGKSPPGVWDWHEEKDGDGNPKKRSISTTGFCTDWNSEQDNASARRINSNDGTPVPLADGKDEGYAKVPQDYWKWRSD